MLVRILLIAGAIGAATMWWSSRGSALDGAEKSPNGFVSAAMPDGAREDTVIILAPLNCPSDAAQRADALSEELTRKGIRNVRSSSYHVNITDPTEEDQAAMERAVAVINGPIPAVFVKGMAKANPSAEEVVAEYRSPE